MCPPLRTETGNLAATLEAARRRLRALQERKREVAEENRYSAMFDAAFGHLQPDWSLFDRPATDR